MMTSDTGIPPTETARASDRLDIRRRCARLLATTGFGRAVVSLIVFNAAVVGLETSPEVMARHGAQLSLLNHAIVGLFLLELAVRWLAHPSGSGRFLLDPWNAFDAAVIGLSLVPGIGPFATVARLARVLRTLRLLSVSPQLRLIVATMMKSIPSLGHVGLLLSLLLYVYGVVGVNLFGAADPRHWGSLGVAMLTLFQILTLEGWVEIQNASLTVTPWAWTFYVSFVLIAVFVVVNLFIAVVLNNLEHARHEISEAPSPAPE
jgi:voltage-gated sodium channel